MEQTPYLVDELLRNSPPKGRISIHLNPLMLNSPLKKSEKTAADLFS